MIIYHQKNISAFKGNHVNYALVKLNQRVSATSATAANELIAQSQSIMRFVQSRVFGRVN